MYSPKEKLRIIEEMLNDDLYAGSKDWIASDVVGRVDLLIGCYESERKQCQMWVDLINYANNVFEKRYLFLIMVMFKCLVKNK